jgi:hypothetical protein
MFAAPAFLDLRGVSAVGVFYRGKTVHAGE